MTRHWMKGFVLCIGRALSDRSKESVDDHDAGNTDAPKQQTCK